MEPLEPPTNGAPPPRTRQPSAVVAGVPRPRRRAGLDDAWPVWPGHTADRLLDDQPVLSGRHPLHLYHGLLGARSFLNRGTLSCYDPAFQAGYPKTPVFDDGSRPAEMLLALAGGRYRPSVYKLGVAGLCLLAPCVFAGAARGGAEPLPRLPGLRPGDARLVGQAVPRSAGGGRRGSAAGGAGRAGAGGPAAALPPRAGTAQRGGRGADGLPRLVRPPDAHGAVGAAVPALLLRVGARTIGCSGTSAWPSPSRRPCWPTSSGCRTGSITGGFARR